jgi:hypothetical protein
MTIQVCEVTYAVSLGDGAFCIHIQIATETEQLGSEVNKKYLLSRCWKEETKLLDQLNISPKEIKVVQEHFYEAPLGGEEGDHI